MNTLETSKISELFNNVNDFILMNDNVMSMIDSFGLEIVSVSFEE